MGTKVANRDSPASGRYMPISLKAKLVSKPIICGESGLSIRLVRACLFKRL